MSDRYYIQLETDFIQKLKKVRKAPNGYIYSDILFRIYFFNHEQKIFPADSEMFATISEHTVEEVREAFGLFKKEGILKYVDSETYFELQKEDFLKGEYKAPKARTKKKDVTKDAYSKRDIDSLINQQVEELKSFWTEYVEMRKKIKKPISVTGMERAIAHLDNLADEYCRENIGASALETKQKILQNSIDNAYQGLFQLKYKPKENFDLDDVEDI